MKRLSLLVLAIAAIAASLMVACPSLRQKHPSSSSESAPRILDILSLVIVPDARLNEIPFEEAIALLNKHAAHAGINQGQPVFILWKKGDPVPANFRLMSPEEQKELRSQKNGIGNLAELSSLNEADSPADSAPAAPSTISLRFTNIPLNELARYVAGLADYIIAPEGDRVLIFPPDQLRPPLVTKEFYLLYPSATIGYPSATPPATRLDLRPFYESNGVTFTPGSFAIYDPSDVKIVVQLEKAELDLGDSILNGVMCGAPEPFESSWERRKWRLHDLWYRFTSALSPKSPASPP